MVYQPEDAFTHPCTNWARRSLTSFVRRTPLTAAPRRQPVVTSVSGICPGAAAVTGRRRVCCGLPSWLTATRPSIVDATRESARYHSRRRSSTRYQLLLPLHTHPFNGPLSRTTRVSRYQKVKPIWILLKQETVSGTGIGWAICKSASRCRQIIMPAPHHSVLLQAG